MQLLGGDLETLENGFIFWRESNAATAGDAGGRAGPEVARVPGDGDRHHTLRYLLVKKKCIAATSREAWRAVVLAQRASQNACACAQRPINVSRAHAASGIGALAPYCPPSHPHRGMLDIYPMGVWLQRPARACQRSTRTACQIPIQRIKGSRNRRRRPWPHSPTRSRP